MKCKRCNVSLGVFAALTDGLMAYSDICPKCIKEIEQEKQAALQAEKEHLLRIRELAKGVIVTTTNNIDGYRSEEYLGIESVECVIGTGLWSELTGELSDLFGRRSTAFEKKLQQAKRAAMETLKIMAAEQGASAIIGIDVDFTEFSGNRVGLIINGTFVKLAPIDQVRE